MNKLKSKGCRSPHLKHDSPKYCNQCGKYQIEDSKSKQKRSEQIEQRRKQIPDIHRANYDKAMRGRSMKAGVKAFCLECCGWQKEEVRLCSDLACPLYPYRPYRISKQASERLGLSAESTKKKKGGI